MKYRFIGGLLLQAALAVPGALWAQVQPTLPLKREPPVLEWAGCPPPGALPAAAPSDPVRAEAARLAAAANESAILGDNAGALAMLDSAAALDPRDPRVAYLRARTLDLLARIDDALAEYCRYSALAPDGADRSAAEDRIADLAGSRGFTVPAAAAGHHAAALAHFDRGQPDLAAAALDSALAAAPDWAAARHNRGVVRLALGQADDAADDLRWYLQLSPGAADFGTVLDLIGRLQAPRLYSPGAALATGLIVPGLGHFTTGRPLRGTVFLGAASAMIGAGLLATTTRVECLAPPVDGRCPDGQVLRQRTERPALVPALVGAAVTGFIGAIDAWRGARRMNEEGSTRDVGTRPDLSVLPASRQGAGRLTLVLVRF